jgi:predicted nucleotidyltransferase
MATPERIFDQKSYPQAVLSQAQLGRLLGDFKAQWGEKFNLTALGYFGSYARGEARPDSDVDVVFETTEPDLLMTSVLKQDLEAWLNRSVDVIRLHPYLNPQFKARLEHEIIYV